MFNKNRRYTDGKHVTYVIDDLNRVPTVARGDVQNSFIYKQIYEVHLSDMQNRLP